jgi:glycosyltransferase involved in cell wall biosynthesis
MKVAIVYDRVNKWGGAERVLLALHALFPDAPLYTSVYDRESAPWANVFEVRTSFLQKIPFARTHHEMFAPLMPLIFESFTFDEFDLVISVTSESAKGIITKPHTHHICICLTPTRYLWSGYKEYFAEPIFRFITRPLVAYLRVWDTIAATRPDTMIAISSTVQARIDRYYHRESRVIFPPTQLSGQSLLFKKSTKRDDVDTPYFLVVSRLSKMTAYKRVDLAIRAANTLKIPLKVIGSGKDFEHYKEMAGPTVEMLGNVADSELVTYYKNCTALIFPGKEDFGLVMVEAHLYGRPVIAYRAGGATEIVQEGKTGEFFDSQSVKSLITVLKSFDRSRYNENDCMARAKKFSIAQFENELKACIAGAIQD